MFWQDAINLSSVNNNAENFIIKPSRIYPSLYVKTTKLHVGDIIPITILNYNFKQRRLIGTTHLEVSNCFIRDTNFLSYNIPETLSYLDIPSALKNYNYKKVIAEVVKIYANGMIELDRKRVLTRTTDFLKQKIGSIVTATVENFREYGLFLDIGNGVESLVYLSEISKCHIHDIRNCFKIGEKIYVKLLSYDSENNHFTVSRKQAYERVTLKPNSIKTVKVFERVNENGYFVEYNPATPGIMDTFENFPEIKAGSNVLVKIKKDTEKGFKANFLCY